MPPKSNTTPKITASPDDGRQQSLVQQIAELEVGKSVSLARRLDGDEATKATILETRESLRNFANSATKRAKDRTGHTYTIEGGEITTRSLDILVVIAITRSE